MIDLKPKISVSEKEFLNKHGKETYFSMRKEKLEKFSGYCEGCRHFFPKEKYNALELHIVEEDESAPENSNSALLCNACHSIQHIDKSIENNWVGLVNSSLSQRQLIDSCRSNTLAYQLQNLFVIKLRMKPEEYLDKIKERTISPGNRIKVVFTSDFPWKF